jgi:isochorismate pyruvate lyase
MRPEECSTINEIRSEIDRIDFQIVSAIAERQIYVRAASKFKTSETAVKAPERQAAMLRQRRAWAQENGLNPDVIEKLFKDLVQHFVQEELAQWKGINCKGE